MWRSEKFQSYSMSLNQSLTVNLKRKTSSSARGEQCAMGPRKEFKLAMTLSTAFLLLNNPPKNIPVGIYDHRKLPKRRVVKFV